jgi:ApaG protein
MTTGSTLIRPQGKFASDTRTGDWRVTAVPLFLDDASDTGNSQYVFGYTIRITNLGAPPARLRHRQWHIVDAAGREEEVKGRGVVGQFPRLVAGESFEYTSHCPLRTPWGTMEGQYEMVGDDGTTFSIGVGRFFLVSDPSSGTP